VTLSNRRMDGESSTTSTDLDIRGRLLPLPGCRCHEIPN
jgi:hypothetical protein